MITYEEQFGIRVVDDIMNLVCHELMEDRYGDSSVGQGGKESHSPLTGVTSAEGYLVALYHTTVLKQDVQFFYLTCHVMELQGGSFVVSQCIEVPIVDDALLYKLIKTGYVFHIDYGYLYK